MCGIIAYKGKENATTIVINGLKHLEYRGYDSWGIAWLGSEKVSLLKKVGKIGEFKEETKLPSSFIAIGHTRWATHGMVAEINAHPHFSCDKNIYVVHNGIIENYEKLRRELIKKGHRFISETDTEVIPHLIEEYRKTNNFSKACEKAFSRLDGLFAAVVLDKKTQEIIGARNGSPLVMGIGKTGLFLASDIPAFLDKTNKVVLIDDKEMAHLISEKNYQIKDFVSKKVIKKKITTINWSANQAEKGKYPHYMIKEIMEIPEVIKKSLWQNKKQLNRVVNLIKQSSKIVFVGCGTAGHACLESKYLFSSFLNLKKPIDFLPAPEFKNFLPSLDKKTLIIAISQSGETIDVIEAVKNAKAQGLKIVSLVNVIGSSLTRASDLILMINAGPEKCVLATKSYLAQLSLIIFLVFRTLSRGKEGIKKLEAISRKSSEILNNQTFHRLIKKLAHNLAKEEHIYIIGRGVHYPTSLESALKIKESCYIHAEAFAGGELKHGVIALVEKGTPCIIHLAKNNEETNTIINAMELKSRGGYLIGIGSFKSKDFDCFITLPETEEIFSPLLNIIPVHLLAYYLAIEKKLDPDKPRNLAKSVTVK